MLFPTSVILPGGPKASTGGTEDSTGLLLEAPRHKIRTKTTVPAQPPKKASPKLPPPSVACKPEADHGLPTASKGASFSLHYIGNLSSHSKKNHSRSYTPGSAMRLLLI